MDDDMLESYIRQHIEASPEPVISFSWHGGEPLLAGLDFYRRGGSPAKKVEACRLYNFEWDSNQRNSPG